MDAAAQGLSFRSISHASGSLLWVQLQDRLIQVVNEGERTESRTRLLGYGFLVDAQAAFTSLVSDLPLKVTLAEDGEEKSTTSLEVAFPAADRMIVRGPKDVDAEQRAWLGEHVLKR